MVIPVSLPGFQTQQLAVETAGLLRGPRLLVNGVPAAGKKGVYSVRSDAGAELQVVIKARFPDPVPEMKVGGAPYTLARPLVWYEYAWMGAPVVLVFAGGAIGGLCGATALYVSSRVFRSGLGTPMKYILTGFISFCALIAFTTFAVIIQVLLRR